MSFWNGNNHDKGFDHGYDDAYKGKGKNYVHFTLSNIRKSCQDSYCKGYDKGYDKGCLDRNRKKRGIR